MTRAPWTAKIVGEVKEIPLVSHADPAVFIPIWDRVEKAGVSLWVQVELVNPSRAHALKLRAIKRGFLAERRKSMVFIRRNTKIYNKV
jgi:hypothetical protein